MNPDGELTDEELAEYIQRKEAMFLALRSIGLFEDTSQDVPGARVTMSSLLVGDLAFSKRVQDPEQVDFDAEFRRMAITMENDDTEALRKKIQEEGFWE